MYYVLCIIYYILYIIYYIFAWGWLASNLLGEPKSAAGGTLGGNLRPLVIKLLYKNPLDKH